MRFNTQDQLRRNIVIDSLLSDVNALEKKINSNNTIILGDFNENPYEEGCLSATKLHGLPCVKDARKESRIVVGNEYKTFYNPMWNYFGDFENPPGTYYHQSSNPIESFWQILDQVIIRPGLIDKFVNDSLQIVSFVEEQSLLDNNDHPNKEISDHLPIIFEIKE